MTRKLICLMAAALAFGGHDIRRAEACGCFVPPDPSVPIVQAGERILFAVKDGEVTAHIQIQYSGAAADFGWLLPLPSVPTLQVGTDELFTALINNTQPKYVLTRKYDPSCGVKAAPGGSNTSTGPTATGDSGGSNLVVIQSSVGPYDYAVLHADSKDDMLAWLDKNHYFVPAGTDSVVAPYIHKDAYFLALKLRSGESTGSLQPVVVKYASDLPMIPIVLTSVAAQPDMGIQVWILGDGRAIPRNYFHTVIDEALLDWSNGAQNYNDVIVRATQEAEGRHTFVTEYAGTASVMLGALGAATRFGSTATLAAEPDAVSFLDYLAQNGYTVQVTGPGGGGPLAVRPGYSSVMLGILGQYIPVPPKLPVASASDFYLSASYYLGSYRDQHPDQFVGWTLDYQPAQMAAAIDERIVQPTRAAAALLAAFPYLTRLYTTLSPEQMNKDPVFSFNRTLPDVANVHNATLEVHCGPFGGGDPSHAPSTLILDNGLRIEYPNGFPATLPTVPYSARIEIVPEEGAPQIVVDNQALIQDRLGGGGCSVAPGGRGPAGMALVLGLLAVLRRRRRSFQG